jgi:SAM-dependent methyltransferase
MYVKKCRLCQSENFSEVIDLGEHPLADSFISPESNKKESYFPLKVAQCQDCYHLFTVFSISPIERYQDLDYSYDSANSDVSINHFKELCETILGFRPLAVDSTILEIGSNTGSLLGHFKDKGFKRITGVDPSKNIALIANEKGIPTINHFFDLSLISYLDLSRKFDLIVGTNVFNHMDDFDSGLKLVKECLQTEGVFVLEVPYLLDLIQNNAFDTIYHEHVHYFSISSLERFLTKAELSISKIERINYMGGSIRLYVQHGKIHNECVLKFIELERQEEVLEKKTFVTLMERARLRKNEIRHKLDVIKQSGGVVIGIGAATKGNTLINFFELTKNDLVVISDSSKLKIGKLTPGSRIPIVSDQEIPQEATHGLILPWNIGDYLKKKFAQRGLILITDQV